MKNIFRFLMISLCWMMFFDAVYAEKFDVHGPKSSNIIKEQAAGCEPGANSKYLDINNVRTLIYSYGNGWFLENAEYEIPKGSRKTSMYSTSLWIGGIDVNNNLKLAAYRYGQGVNGNPHTHNDFWPGPLTIDGTAAIDQATCAQYDQLFPMTRLDVEAFLAYQENKADFPNYTIPPSIRNWPAHGDMSKGQAYYLAPFMDVDGDGDYNYEKGDYPYYDLANKLCPHNLKPGERAARARLKNGEADDTLGILVDQVIKGDQTLWNVYNDKGNFHSETQGAPIGLEIRQQSFAFATNDEINNMTFYSYEIINRSTFTLTNTYFSQWVDPDLGWYLDDFVGCDVGRGLGYCYNGKPIDGEGEIQAYGAHPPAVGVDFFQGPYLDPDGYDNPSFKGNGIGGPSFHGDCSIVGLNGSIIDMTYGPNNSKTGSFLVRSEAINGVNFGDGIIDNERYGMRRFVYHNNNQSGVPFYMQDPTYAPEYYNFLKGIWKDNTKMWYGGNANVTDSKSYGPACDFMFPGDSDPCDWGTNGQPPNGLKYWTEETAGNPYGDRRFMQSAGPFTLQPGACNYITVGIPWARSISGTPFESVELLRQVDDKCQALFDNCFAVLNGPNAPDLTIEELDRELILYVSNRKSNDAGNNFQEKYTEFDPNIPNPDTLRPRNDSLYHFEGYQIFQLKDATVSSADIMDVTKSRLVAQCDVQNNVTKLVNWLFDQSLNGNVGTVMVDGTDKGIQHSFVITTDAFSATGDPRLINHKQYYYLAVAYAYNNYLTYVQAVSNNGQKMPYLQGRNNLKLYTGIPHIPMGDRMNSSYGDGPVITRIEGQGNGGMILDFSQETINSILNKPLADSVTNTYGGPDYPIAYKPVYLASAGPLNIKVIDPLNVVSGKYTVRFDSMTNGPATSPFTNKTIQFGKWELIDSATGKIYRSDTTTIYPYEQLFLDLGLAITINQVPFPGDTLKDGTKYTDNGLLYAPPAIYTDPSQIWLSGVPDNDVPADDQNWIRAGSYKSGDNLYFDDWNMEAVHALPWDPNKNFAKIQGGTWAPYILTAFKQQLPYSEGPAFDKYSKQNAGKYPLASVDIVITNDNTKWSRCPVIEMCADKALAEGGAPQYGYRFHRSVNVDGDTGKINTDPRYNSDYISPVGMGWFPGYAINLETGERLNIMFSENSWLVADNGRDMIWNPTSRIFNSYSSFYPVFGGQHYVYIMGSWKHSGVLSGDTAKYDFPAYDGGAYIRSRLNRTSYIHQVDIYKIATYSTALYVGVPLSVEGKQWLSNPVTIKIRVNRPYQRYYSSALPIGSTDTMNKNYPLYNFSTSGIATAKNNYDKTVSDLDLINVVPNPYYAYDDYERNQLDNRIKITNLPLKCTITIFNINGTLIRQFIVDKSGISEPRSSTIGINTDAKTSIDWDLKNFAGIPVSGGVYLIHVKAAGIGERTIKWFGILRPVDLNSF